MQTPSRESISLTQVCPILLCHSMHCNKIVVIPVIVLVLELHTYWTHFFLHILFHFLSQKPPKYILFFSCL